MGIQGLLGMLKEASVPQHINQWKGKTLAVDAYVWLHRGAYGCAEELATGKTTIKYVNYAMHRVRMLKHYGVTPLIVFDGGLLPSKMGTEDDRERRRNDALAKGNAFLAEGKGSQARDCFVKAVDVTPEMAYQLIKALRREGVQYIVAPYEADPQLAYLERAGLVDGIISEDSDLLVFGCRQVLFKLDGEGNCVGIARDDFTKCREYNFAGWTDKEFRQMAILSGCDYLESIQGVGLKTAYRLMRKYKTAEKVIQFVRLEGQLKVPRSYPDDFKRAELTFLHQRVWDPVQNALVHLEPVPAGVDAAVEWPFIGAPLEPEYARQLACGEMDPITKLPMVDINPESFLASQAYSPAPFKPLTERNTSSSTSKKSTSTPIPTKGTLLNFFTKASPSPSFTSTPKPALGAGSSKLKVQMIQPQKLGPTSTAMVRDQGGFASKFFGGGGAAAKGKGKEKEAEEVRVEVVAVMSGSESEGDVESGTDLTAEPPIAELDLPPPPMMLDDDAISTLQEHWHEDLTSSDGEPLPPLPPLPSDEEMNDVDHLSDLTEDTAAPLPLEHPPPQSPPPRREPSLAASSCAGISSPASTPPKRGRLVRGRKPKPRLGVIEDDEAEAEDDEGALLEEGEEARSEVTSDWGISSPAPAPAESVSRKEKGKGKKSRAEMEAPEEEEGEDEMDEGGLGDVMSSPIASPPMRRKEAPAAPAPAIVVKQEKVDSSKVDKKKSKKHYVELSSDPIDLSSDMIIEEEDEAEESTPRPAVREKKSKEPSSSSGSRSGSGKEGKKTTTTTMGKKRSSQVLEDEDDEEREQVVQSVAMAWKAKYMMNSGASKSPKLTPSTAARRSLPTPTTTSLSRTIKPPLTRQPTISRPSLSSTSKPRPSLTAGGANRLPLSPRSTNRRAPQMLVPGSSSPPPQKQQKKVEKGSSLQEDRQEEEVGSDDPVVIRTSSSPVIITNPRLLAFRYGGGATAMKL